MYLLLAFLPHAQSEHGVEVRAGDGQQGSVSRDPLVVCHQHHIAELAVLPLLIEALQHLHSLIHPAEHLPTQHADNRFEEGLIKTSYFSFTASCK